MKHKIMTFAALSLMATAGSAQNPFVQTWFTSDPAPMVYGDRLYVYTGHDEDGADFFWMQEWRIYSTQDMVNWQDHGSPLALESFSWADDRAWASQCIERNGKFYWYICAHSRLSKGMAIGVAVSDTPTGPFRDALGKPLYENGSWDHIDPTVMIDDDGQAWLLWGNPQIYYCKLNEDMVSINGEVKLMDMTEEAFGAPLMKQREKGKQYKDSYVEGPWLSKRNGKYQLLYAAGGVPEHISYSTAPSVSGPWTYASEIMPLSETKSFTNHCGVTDYKGHSYFFYHTGKLPGGGGFGRSVAVEEFKYNDDGSFPTILPTDEGVKPIATFNPYQKVEAETMAFSKGVKTEQRSADGPLQVYVTDIHNDDYIKLQHVDFGRMLPRTFTARVASGLRGGKLEVRIDSVRGQRLCTLDVRGTGGWDCWKTLVADIQAKVEGVHDLYFVFTGRKGPKLFNFDWWEMRGIEQWQHVIILGFDFQSQQRQHSSQRIVQVASQYASLLCLCFQCHAGCQQSLLPLMGDMADDDQCDEHQDNPGRGRQQPEVEPLFLGKRINLRLLLLRLVNHLHLAEPALVVVGGEALHHLIYFINIFAGLCLFAQLRIDICQQPIAAHVAVGGILVAFVDGLQRIVESLFPFTLLHGNQRGCRVDFAACLEHQLVIVERQRFRGEGFGAWHVLVTVHEMYFGHRRQHLCVIASLFLPVMTVVAVGGHRRLDGLLVVSLIDIYLHQPLSGQRYHQRVAGGFARLDGAQIFLLGLLIVSHREPQLGYVVVQHGL